MKLKIIVLILVYITIFNSCKDISFNNPFDPDASKETAKIVKIIDTQTSGIGDIEYFEATLWKTTLSGNYYLLDVESGIIIRSIQGQPGNGIAIFDGRIYICNGENNIHVYDSLSGDLLKQILTTEIYPQYCFFSEERLIVFDNRSKSIFSLNIETGESMRLFEISGTVISGICSYKEGLLIADDQTDSIYFYSMTGEIRDVFRSPATDISGITRDDNNFIYIYNLNGQIYKVSLP